MLTPISAGKIVSVNGLEVTPEAVSVRVYVPVATVGTPVSVSVALPFTMFVGEKLTVPGSPVTAVTAKVPLMTFVVTGNVTDPPLPSLMVPDCAPTVMDGATIWSTNDPDVALPPLIGCVPVSVRVCTPNATAGAPVSVKVPLPFVMISGLSTVTPAGRFVTVML